MICYITQSQDVQSAQIFVVALTCLGEKHGVFVKLLSRGHQKPSEFGEFCDRVILLSNSWLCFRFNSGVLPTAKHHVNRKRRFCVIIVNIYAFQVWVLLN